MRNILTVWAGQTVSSISSKMTGFAIGIWMFEQTGRSTALALTGVFALVPTLILTLFHDAAISTPMILARTGNDEAALAAVSAASGVGVVALSWRRVRTIETELHDHEQALLGD